MNKAEKAVKSILQSGVMMGMLLLSMEVKAERLMQIPTGYVLDPLQVRLEYNFQASHPESYFAWASIGLTPRFEIEGQFARPFKYDQFETINAQWSVLTAIPGYFPALSVGVRDLLDESAEGIGFYAAATYKILLVNNYTDRDFALHVGVGLKGIRGGFVGFELPLTRHFTLMAEHDSFRLNVGLEWSPHPIIKLRGMLLEDRLHFGTVVKYPF